MRAGGGAAAAKSEIALPAHPSRTPVWSSHQLRIFWLCRFLSHLSSCLRRFFFVVFYGWRHWVHKCLAYMPIDEAFSRKTRCRSDPINGRRVSKSDRINTNNWQPVCHHCLLSASHPALPAVCLPPCTACCLPDDPTRRFPLIFPGW